MKTLGMASDWQVVNCTAYIVSSGIEYKLSCLTDETVQSKNKAEEIHLLKNRLKSAGF